VAWRPVETRGYGRNSQRWVVELDGGARAFVKLALDDTAAGWLRDEHRVYAAIEAPFLPRLLGWHDPDPTFLVLEDLSEARWVPPWDDEAVAAVHRSLDELHATAPPAGLPSVAALRDQLDGWPEIAAEPGPFLTTGLCSAAWLERSLETLLGASGAAPLEGESLLHFDVRSDNLCLRGGRAVLFDWNLASVGDPLLDTVAWLPSLWLEGGPDPWLVVRDSGGLAALIAGFFASRAGLPPPPTAPTVRDFQRRQGAITLAWAARELGLPPPEGS
jgi:hypothetical protein